MCVDAYLLLRKKGNLLISLFMMMLSTGLPELKTVDDLKYLQVSIHVYMCVCVDVNLLSSYFESSFNEQKLTSSQQSYFASYGVRGYITLICFAYLSLHYLEPGSKLRIGIVEIYQNNTFCFFGVVPSINRNQIAQQSYTLSFPSCIIRMCTICFFVKETLKLDLSEADATKHFLSKFKEALNKSWSTSVNWGFHNAVRNN